MTRSLILTPEQIELKIRRMAFQIWEHNSSAKDLVMIGIDGSGYILAELLAQHIKAISKIKVQLLRLHVNKEKPLEDLPQISQNLNGASVVMVDDVANSGKVLLYALKPVLEFFPKKILMAVLVDRKHKAYPVNPDIVGHSLSTTLQENIFVETDGERLTGVYLE